MADIQDWNSQMRRGLLELCVLALLEARPGYGYEIVTSLAEADPLAASEGTVYPLLRRLRRFGWLETFWRESDSGPPRQYYQLTEKGLDRLRQLEAEWGELRRSVDERLAYDRRAPAVTAGGRVPVQKPQRRSR
ncbi:MAG TPA: PadR family transcriptional regulator [Thermoanaerobaculia bacterium]|nr:PadR family transcriptional regulator [Thermoanaerobaculia bacterium]